MSTKDERRAKLISALTEGTKTGRVKWHLGSFSAAMRAMTQAMGTEMFEAKLQAGIVRLAASTPTSISLAILDDQGNTLQSWIVKKNAQPPAGPLETLYDMARDNALGLADVIDKIVRESTGE